MVQDVLKTIGKWEDDWEGDEEDEEDEEDDGDATFFEGHEALDDECGEEFDTTFLSCQCGKVEISLPSKSIQRFRCCCCDCRKGMEYFHTAKGGPAPPSVPDLVYYPNVLMVCEEHAHLRCFTLQKGFPTRRVYAACCWTPLLADHPGYENSRLVVYNRPAKLKCTGTFAHNRSPLRRPDSRICQSDLSAMELGALKPFQPPRDARSWPDATRCALAAVAAMKEPSTGGWRRKWSMLNLVTAQQLIASLPRGIEVADPAHQRPTPAWLCRGDDRANDKAAGVPSPKAGAPHDAAANVHTGHRAAAAASLAMPPPTSAPAFASGAERPPRRSIWANVLSANAIPSRERHIPSVRCDAATLALDRIVISVECPSVCHH